MKSYALHRPIGPFTWPSEYHDKVIEIVNWDCMEYVPEIKRSAFGYIEWSELPPMEDLRRYELMVPPENDQMLTKIGKILAKYERLEQWDQFEKAWTTAKDKYGYSEDEIERTWLSFSSQEHV